MDQSIYKQLIDILKQEYEQYMELNKIALSKKDTIVENRVDELSELIKEDDDIIAIINNLEKERSDIILEICQNNNLSDNDINFSNLIKVIPAPWQDELYEVRQKLLKIIDELHIQNEQNSFLVSEAIKLNTASLNIFINALQPENKIYNMKQKSTERKSSHIIDRRG